MFFPILWCAAALIYSYFEGRDAEKRSVKRAASNRLIAEKNFRLGCPCKTCNESRERERADRGEAYA